MTRTEWYLHSLLHELIELPNETGWVEFKHNNQDPKEIGSYISALSNSAVLNEKSHAYLIWGINDATRSIVGTSFRPTQTKIGNEELESWLLRSISPRVFFRFYELTMEQSLVVILEIERTMDKPVQFQGTEYIRVGSYKKFLKGFPEMERALWRTFDKTPFEELNALEDLSESDVLKLLDFAAYFDLLDLEIPSDRNRIIAALESDKMIHLNPARLWNVTNLGAILFAKKLSRFSGLARKAVRVILYKDRGRIETIREFEDERGYAVAFESLVTMIDHLLPRNEVIGKALRQEVSMYPQLAVRELIANAIIHQDFSIKGTGPMIEIFLDRMEITNPGIPLVQTERFLDHPPRSRNEALASFMRRIGVCEERGSGFDKVVYQTEVFQLPAPSISVTDAHTKISLFAHLPLSEMEKEDRIRACYLHACLKYVMRESLTNTSLRQRFGLEEKHSSHMSRLIKDAVEANMIKPKDPDTAPKHMKYVPFWA